MNLLSLLSTLGGATAVGHAAVHNASWAWAIGTSLSALGPTIHLVASWMRARELRDARHSEQAREVEILRGELEALKTRLGR